MDIPERPRDPTGTTVADRPGARAAADDGEPPLVLGGTVGRYVIVGEVGEGGMGRVHRAFDPDLNRMVAIKLLRPRREGTEGRRRLLREAQAMAKLSHPNVVSVYDVGAFEDRVFIAMELVPGMDLKRWLADEPRSWRAIIDIFAQVARGLAAAHRAGILHRDVKPANLLVGDDGRARVVDFGVARTTEDYTSSSEPEPTTPSLADEEASQSSDLLAQPITAFGAFVGTPAYMAPEQREGRTDERTDQYQLGLSLYEALYGRRPERTDDGHVESTPRLDRRVPSWVHAVIERALAEEPDARFGSMDQVAEALERDPAVRRRRVLVIATGLALVGALSFSVTRGELAGPSVCEAGAEEIRAAWNDERAEAVRRAILASDAPTREAAWAEVDRRFDAYAADWAAMHREACEATHVRGEQSMALLDARMVCLRQRREELDALVDVLAGADAETVERAAVAANELRSLGDCAHPASLASREPPPAGEADHARFVATRREVADARALLLAGQLDEGVRRARAATEAATELGHEPLVADAEYTLALGLDFAGDVQEAAEALHRAGQAAIAGRDPVLTAHVWIRLVLIEGDRLGNPELAARWADYADAAVDAVRPHPELEWQLAMQRGVLAGEQGRFDESAERLTRALELATQLHGADSFAAGQIHLSLGLAYAGMGDFERALVHCERDIEITEATLGPWHPSLGQSLSNASQAYYSVGRVDEARASVERAIVIWERSHGPEYGRLAMPLHNLGDIELRSGHAARAVGHYRRSLALWERSNGPDHPDLAYPSSGLARALHRLGRDEEARGHARRAVEIWERAHDEAHPFLVDLYTLLGEIELSLGDAEAAASHLERARRQMDPERTAPASRGALRLALARAAFAEENAEEARDLARAARADLVAAGPGSADRLAELDAWGARLER